MALSYMSTAYFTVTTHGHLITNMMAFNFRIFLQNDIKITGNVASFKSTVSTYGNLILMNKPA